MSESWALPASLRQYLDETRRAFAASENVPLVEAPTPEKPVRFKTRTSAITDAELSGPASLAPYIDHTLLKADATAADVERVAREAREHGFATVCVNSSQVARVAAVLEGSPTLPIAVVGFPLGAALAEAKAFETAKAIAAGAREIDTVINVGALKSGDFETVYQDLALVVEAAGTVPVKVILETCLLTTEEKVLACALSRSAGAAFVKTSTGFSTGGATADDIALMRQVVGPSVGVKASGGIRSADDAFRMVKAGANRLGASASVAIIQGEVSSSRY